MGEKIQQLFEHCMLFLLKLRMITIRYYWTLHWKTDSLSEDETIKLKELLSEYQDVFALNNPELSSKITVIWFNTTLRWEMSNPPINILEEFLLHYGRK